MADLFQNSIQHRIAILVDGDNAQPSLMSAIIDETSKYGLITIRRIYGDWTTANMSGWKDTLQTHAIQPIQQFRYTTGKNATDSAMIIDAMDILYSAVVDSFCLVSSDSDYTRLATRIREKGFFVMGVGKKTTPRAFVNGCDLFLYTENLSSEISSHPESHRKGAADSEQHSTEPLSLLKKAFEMAVQDDGWASLGVLGSHLRQLDPGFDPRTYGYKRLSSLIRSFSQIYRIKEIKSEDGPSSAIYIKLKE